MKISELIAELEEIQRMSGDIEVYAGARDSFSAVESVEYSYEDETADIILDTTN